MRVTVNVPDSFISVNGVILHFSFDAPADISVIQWSGDDLHGQIERKSGAEPFKNPAVIEPYLAAWQAELSRRYHVSVAEHAETKADHTVWLNGEKKRLAEIEEARRIEESKLQKKLAEQSLVP